jgi:hypothetical protein
VGKIKSPEQTLLFVGTLYSDHKVFVRSKEILVRTFGDSLSVSPPLPWDHSSYYKDELGWPIIRRFVFFRDPIDPGNLADIKLLTNDIEDSFSLDDKRRINLDPGYITLSRVVLASTKNRAHRIYLGKGIYGEVTLLYSDKEGTFKPHLFTYRDYQEKSCIDVFMNARRMLQKMPIR